MTTPLTLDEAAARIGMSVSTVVRLCKRGKLEYSQDATGTYAIDPASLERWATQNIAPAGWIGMTAAAEIIGCYGTNVNRYIQQGKLEARKYGGRQYVEESAVRQFAKVYKSETVGQRRAEGGRATAAKVKGSKGSNWASMKATATATTATGKRKPAEQVKKHATIDDMVKTCKEARYLSAMDEQIGVQVWSDKRAREKRKARRAR